MRHQLYKTGDADAPEAILDRNREVVLALCRICGRGEVELGPECPGGTIALLSETLVAGRERLWRVDPKVRFDAETRATLSDGRRVVIVLPDAERDLRGREFTGFWIEGRVPFELIELAGTRVRRLEEDPA